MAKMFYLAEEAASKLGVSPDNLKQLVAENKLREFRDGARVMYKVDQVDRLASEAKTGSSVIGLSGAADSGIDLAPSAASRAPASSAPSGHDSVSLAEADVAKPATPAKDDTVVTGQGVNVLGAQAVRPVDASAQTQISSPIDEGISPSSLEGVGSGSGLLDLTRESDDTSLGAELLDEIYPGKEGGKTGIGSATGIFEQTPSGPELTSGPSGLENITPSTSVPLGVTTVVEAADPYAGAFGGMALAAVCAMLLAGIVCVAAFEGFMPGFVAPLARNVYIFIGVLVVASLLFSGVGYFAGKASTR